MRNVFLYSIGFTMLFSGNAGAQAKKKSQSSRNGTPQIVEATVQRTLYGRRESQPRVDYRFVLIWKNRASPSVFYWRPDAKTWRDVTIASPERRPGLGPNDFMIVERHMKYTDIHNGDQIIVTPHSHDEIAEEMPAAVRKMPSSCLYYKIGNQWQYVPIKPTKRPDIAMP